MAHPSVKNSLTTLALVSGLLASSASAYELRKDSTGAEVRWADRVDFVFDSQANKILRESHSFDAAQAALGTLQAAVPELAFSLQTGSTGGMGYSQTGKNVNVIVAIEEDWPFDADAIAVTVITVNTKSHEILDADIAFNAAARKFRVLDSRGEPLSSYDDIQNTLTHELGHALGLSHVPDEPDAVMYPSASRGEVKKRELSKDDASGLSVLYAPPSEASAGSTAKAAGCSTSGGGVGGLVPWLAVLGVLGLRKLQQVYARAALQRVSVKSLALPLLVLAASVPVEASASPRRAPAQVAASTWTASGKVESMRTLPALRHGVLFSEVTVVTSTCHRGPCPARFTVEVAGGHLGELEQIVGDAPVPSPEAAVAVVRSAQASALYRLDVAEDLAAIRAGLESAGVSSASLGTESPSPSRPTQPQRR